MSRVIQEHKSRQTGTTVQVIDNRDRDFDSCDPNEWFCLCVDHGGVVSHQTRALAVYFAPVPREWCPGCQQQDAELKVGAQVQVVAGADAGEFGEVVERHRGGTSGAGADDSFTVSLDNGRRRVLAGGYLENV